jgi:hypothetical protein
MGVAYESMGPVGHRVTSSTSPGRLQSFPNSPALVGRKHRVHPKKPFG